MTRFDLLPHALGVFLEGLRGNGWTVGRDVPIEHHLAADPGSIPRRRNMVCSTGNSENTSTRRAGLTSVSFVGVPKALGLTVPTALLAAADEVIE